MADIADLNLSAAAMAAVIADTGRAICQAVGVPPRPDDGWDEMGAELAEDVAMYLNAAAVMADATPLAGADS